MGLRFAIAFFLLAVAPALAAEKGAAAGTGSTLDRAVQSKIPIEDQFEGHQLVQAVAVDRIATPDRIGGVAFEGAEFRRFEQADLTDGAGMVRGYGVWQARTGEKLFVVYGYTMPPAAPERAAGFSGTFEWVGGTGALAGLRGKGTLEGESSREGRTKYRWAGSFERAGTVSAGRP